MIHNISRHLIRPSVIQPYGAPPVLFAPTDLANCVLWLDANDIATITKDGSNLVSSWLDKSTALNHATQSTMANQPVYDPSGMNGRPALTQTGAPQLMLLTSGITMQNKTMFCVMSTLNKAPLRSFMGNSVTGSSATVDVWAEYYDGLNYADFSESLTNNVPFVRSAVLNASPSTAVVYKNGSALGGAGSSGVIWTGTYDLIGARTAAQWNWNGAYSEYIIYDRNLSGAEVTQVTDYLIQKWAIV